MYRLLLAIFFLSNLNLTHAESDAKYWEELGINATDIQDFFLNEKHCKISKRHFSSCLWALSNLIQLKHKDMDAQDLILVQPLKQPFDYMIKLKPLTADYGLSILRLGDASIKTRNQKIRSYLSFMETSFEGLSALPLATLIDQGLKYQVAGQRMELNGVHFGALYNVYMGVFESSNSYLLPWDLLNAETEASSDLMFGFTYITVELAGKKVVKLDDVEFGSPARRKGLKDGDYIIAVNGKKDLEQIIKLIDRKTQDMVLLIERDQKRFNVRFSLNDLKINNVEHEQFKYQEKTYDYIRVRSFIAQSLCTEVKARAVLARQQKVQGLVLDLRGNGGGYVHLAYCLLGLFMEAGSVKSIDTIDNGAALNVKYYTQAEVQENYYSTVPVVVLIDGNSASASEIVAGNLQVFNKALLLGERSFGKGVMQDVDDRLYFGQGADERMAVLYRHKGYYFLANGTSPQLKGLIPELPYYRLPGQSEPSEFFRMEDELRPVSAINLPIEVDQLQKLRGQQVQACLATLPKDLGLLKKDEADDVQKDRGLAALSCQNQLQLPMIYKRKDYPKSYQDVERGLHTQLPISVIAVESAKQD